MLQPEFKRNRLVNSIRVGLLRQKQIGSPGHAAVEMPSSAKSESRWVRRMKRLVRRPANRVRAFLNRPIEQHLAVIDGRSMEQLQLLQKLQNEIGGSLAALRSELAGLQRDLGTVSRDLGVATRINAARADELEIKVRPILHFDDAVAVRLGDGYVLVPTSEQIFVAMLADATSGGLEPGCRSCLRRLLEPGMTMIDVGANIGLLSLAAARCVGPTGKVLAFEPEERFATLLERTARMNGVSWMRVQRQAVGANNEERPFFISSIPGHSSLFQLPEEERSHQSCTVNVKQLDAIVPAGEPIHLIKIDVEGAELDVLAGAQRILRENRDLAVIAEFGPSHLKRTGILPSDWFDSFARLGFDAYVIAEPSGECSPTSAEQLVDVESVNIAFVRRGGAAASKIRR
jgi:FkbM family methyltransferase